MKSQLGMKLLFGFLVIYLLMVMNAYESVANAREVDDDVTTMIESNYNSALASERMVTALYDLNLQESYYLSSGSSVYLENYNTSKEDFRDWYEEALSVITVERERQLLDSINGSFGEYNDYHGQIVELYQEGRVEDANNLSLGASNDKFFETFDLCIELELLNTESVDRAYRQSKDVIGQGITTISFISVVSLGIAILLGIVISRSITTSIRSLAEGAERLGRGELGYQVQVRTRDEIYDLSRTFNLMSQRLKERNDELGRKRVELEEANAQLKKLDELKSLLLGNISHELRTPLASIKGHVEVVLDEQVGDINDAQEEMLRIANADADHLDRLIEELLVVPGIEFGKLRLHRSPVELEEVLDWAITRLRKAIDGKGVAVELELPPDLPPVDADRDKLVQVFTNLVKNAVNFSPRGGVIRVRGEADGHRLVVRVMDRGIGIPEDHLEDVFEKFYQVDPTSTRAVGGVGLGLYICKGIVEAHGGTMRARSREGEGTEMVVALPLEEVRGP